MVLPNQYPWSICQFLCQYHNILNIIVISKLVSKLEAMLFSIEYANNILWVLATVILYFSLKNQIKLLMSEDSQCLWHKKVALCFISWIWNVGNCVYIFQVANRAVMSHLKLNTQTTYCIYQDLNYQENIHSALFM